MTAVVTEQGTGIEMNSTWSTTVKEKSIKIDLNSWSGTAFKNGLPFYGLTKVATADGHPLGDKMVELCAQPSYDHSANNKNKLKKVKIQQYRKMQMLTEQLVKRPSFEFCTIRKTNEHGVADFALFPSEPDLSDFTIKV